MLQYIHGTIINFEYHHYEVYMEDIWKYDASSHS